MSFTAFATAFLPECVLLVGACLTLFVGVLRFASRSSASSFVALATVLVALAAALCPEVHEAGANLGSFAGLWSTELTNYVRVAALAIGALILLVNWHQPVDEERGEYMGFILLSLLGVLLTASANDLLVLFFAIELVSIPTYVLIALSRLDQRASEASVKYFFLGALSAAILAYGLTFLYGASGTTTLFDSIHGQAISTLAGGDAITGSALIGLLLVLAGLAFKIAAVPFHVYAPDVYEGAAAPITGLLGFVPKFAGFIALAKILSVFSWDLPQEILWVLWLLAAVTMTTGNVLALLQTNVKRTLAYSSIAHTGFMLIAILAGPTVYGEPFRNGVAAMLFYISVYGVMNLGAFALLSSLRIGDREAETLDDLAGLAKRFPASALMLAICIFGLMGMPPTMGFLGKFYVLGSALSTSTSHNFHNPLIALAIIGVINAAIAAAYYLRIIATVYMGKEVEPTISRTGRAAQFSLVLCGLITLLLFAWPIGLHSEAKTAAKPLAATTINRHVAIATTP